MLPGQPLLQRVISIARQAGEEIMTIYQRESPPDVETKADDSPLTEADTRAHALIQQSLLALYPGIPVLSEESVLLSYTVRRQWSCYWLVDPLDGTKEFISRNGEFTVNIALIAEGRPVLGVVHVPVTGVTYSAITDGDDAGAWRGTEAISVRQLPPLPDWPALTLSVVASRRHGGEQLLRLLDTLKTHVASVQLVNMGSSLKICLVAEGKADLYPRFAPTSEWDTAAAHAVLRAAGGDVVDCAFDSLSYNQKESILNPHFIAVGSRQNIWSALLGK